MIDNSKEYILCAAIRRKEPRQCPLGSNPYHSGLNDILDIEIGFRHHDIYQRFYPEMSRKPQDQGFYTSNGRFVNREEGMRIAYECGQVPKEKAFLSNGEFNELFSEDLYLPELKNGKLNY